MKLTSSFAWAGLALAGTVLAAPIIPNDKALSTRLDRYELCKGGFDADICDPDNQLTGESEEQPQAKKFLSMRQDETCDQNPFQLGCPSVARRDNDEAAGMGVN
ncbi:hypothetical protein AJ79_01100 [Helicocarpus griseus UAMH5409]|uniref:Uncharacterized protein n=1 Tax=Helicocarpus griseus UAMH5409 TaxID=1447875 RepID=A0A2B7Y8H3_9EURO|nr:hypothetical protein AJ79_01100 [Helicocarpus griseus UAMH5409]